MDRLDEDRAVIDEIDEQLVQLFEKRFHTVEDIISYKMENNMEILDASRESVITEKNLNRLTDESLHPYFKKWYEEMLALSRAYQKEIKERRQ